MLFDELIQLYLICMLADPIFILLVGSFYNNTCGAMLGATT